MQEEDFIEDRDFNPMTRAALAYCVGSVIALFFLSATRKPFDFYGAHRGEELFLGKDPAQGILWGLGLGAILALTGELFIRRTHWGKAVARMLRSAVGVLHPLDALLLALLSAFGEELIFRGAIMPYTGLFGSSLIFGLLHLVPRKRLWVWAAWAFAAGLGLGFLAQKSGGILAPFTAHFIVNFVGLLTIGRRKS